MRTVRAAVCLVTFWMLTGCSVPLEPQEAGGYGIGLGGLEGTFEFSASRRFHDLDLVCDEPAGCLLTFNACSEGGNVDLDFHEALTPWVALEYFRFLENGCEAGELLLEYGSNPIRMRAWELGTRYLDHIDVWDLTGTASITFCAVTTSPQSPAPLAMNSEGSYSALFHGGKDEVCTYVPVTENGFLTVPRVRVVPSRDNPPGYELSADFYCLPRSSGREHFGAFASPDGELVIDWADCTGGDNSGTVAVCLQGDDTIVLACEAPSEIRFSVIVEES